MGGLVLNIGVTVTCWGVPLCGILQSPLFSVARPLVGKSRALGSGFKSQPHNLLSCPFPSLCALIPHRKS